MNIINENLLRCIDKRDFDAFVSLFGSTIASEYLKTIEFLVSTGGGKIQFDRIDALAEFFFVELSGAHFGEPFHFEVDRNMASFQEFIYLLSVFQAIKAPFEKWEELTLKIIEILTDLVEQGNLDYKRHPQFPTFKKRFNQILDEIIKEPEMERKYTDFLNGAL